MRYCAAVLPTQCGFGDGVPLAIHQRVDVEGIERLREYESIAYPGTLHREIADLRLHAHARIAESFEMMLGMTDQIPVNAIAGEIRVYAVQDTLADARGGIEGIAGERGHLAVGAHHPG